jgi:hypothetical protein
VAASRANDDVRARAGILQSHQKALMGNKGRHLLIARGAQKGPRCLIESESVKDWGGRRPTRGCDLWPVPYGRLHYCPNGQARLTARARRRWRRRSRQSSAPRSASDTARHFRPICRALVPRIAALHHGALLSAQNQSVPLAVANREKCASTPLVQPRLTKKSWCLHKTIVSSVQSPQHSSSLPPACVECRSAVCDL